MSWNEEKVNKLKELWGKGNTASQIAEIIGGISRNAVIGKAHRLNLSAKIKTRYSNTQHPNQPSQVWTDHHAHLPVPNRSLQALVYQRLSLCAE